MNTTDTINKIKKAGHRVNISHLRRLKNNKHRSALVRVRDVKPDKDGNKPMISPTGGATHMRIEFNDGTIREAKFGVWHEDSYEKETGRYKCLAHLAETVPDKFADLFEDIKESSLENESWVIKL